MRFISMPVMIVEAVTNPVIAGAQVVYALNV